MKLLLLVAYFLLVSISSVGQLSSPSFNAPNQLCVSENFVITNTTVGSQFEWDFCEGDLHLSPTLKTKLVDGFNIPVGVSLIEVNNKWFGFICSLVNSSIFRIDYGESLDNPNPTIVNLGNVGGLLFIPQDIKVIQYDDEFLAFVNNRGNNRLVRIDLGFDIQNSAPTSTTLVTGGGFDNGGLDVVYDGNSWVVALTNSSNLTIIRLGLDPKSIPSATDILNTSPIQNGDGIGDIKFVKENENWFAFIVCFNSKTIHRLDFGNVLFTDPNTEKLQAPIFSSFEPYGLVVEKDNRDWIIFAVTREGALQKFNLGYDIRNNEPNYYNLGNLGGMFGTQKIDLVRTKSRWYAFTTNYSNNSIYHLSFPDSECSFSKKYSYSDDTVVLKSYKSGVHYLSLVNKSDYNQFYATSSVEVKDKDSPVIDFFVSSICVNTLSTVFPISSENIIACDWDLGIFGSSNLKNPSINFTSTSDFKFGLSLSSENGCNNYVEKAIKIYDPPTSLFDLPPGLICTNNEFMFTNNTVDNFDGYLTYEWSVNDIQKSTERDFNYSFNTEGDQQIKLITSIPGCSSELTQPLLNVQTGPVVNFSFTGKCEDETIVFTNQSAGLISGYQWDFGDGRTSTEESPAEIYADIGNYNVSLLTTGTNGCASTITRPVNIYSVPQTDFAPDLPPFACSESLSQFNDLTPPMPDSNVTTWAWAFGDPLNGSSSQKNPLYTYSLAGDYSVSLTTTTNYGCSNTSQKTVTIYPSPKADFSFGPACVDKATPFTDLSTGDVKSWSWSIQGNTYTQKNPVHTFKSAADYSALLTVTGSNKCVSQVSKNVTVPVPVVADFTTFSTCATKPALFDEVNKNGVDPAVSWTWNFAGQNYATAISPAQHIFPTTGNKSVTMTTTRKSGCTYSINKIIPIVEPPTAAFTVFVESGAAPFTPLITNTSTRATTYLWKPGDAKQMNSEVFSPSFTYTELGDYLIELEAGNALGCKDQAQQPVYLVVPKINASISDLRLVKMQGSNNWSSEVTIQNHSNVALVDPEVYLDISGNTLISEKVKGVIKPNSSLPYLFTSSIAPRAVDFACAEIRVDGDTYLFDNRQCVNVDEAYISMVPYPNPAQNELMLEWINISSEPMNVVIYNASGQAIISRQYTPTLKGLNQVKMDVSGLAAGIYFVSYAVDGQVQNFKFSVAR